MARRERSKLHPAAGEERITAEEKRVGPLAQYGCEGGMDFLAIPGIEDLNLQPNATGSRFDVPQRGLCGRCVGRIDEHGHTSGGWDEVTQEVQPLRRQLAADKVDARRVTTRPVEAGDKTELDRVF